MGQHRLLSFPIFTGFIIAHFLRHFIQWLKERLSFRFAEKTAFAVTRTF